MTEAERQNLLSPIDAAAILQGYREGLFTEARLETLLANYAAVQEIAREADRDGKLAPLLAAARTWHGFNSNDNGHKLYEASGAYFGSDFNPFDYDTVP